MRSGAAGCRVQALPPSPHQYGEPGRARRPAPALAAGLAALGTRRPSMAAGSCTDPCTDLASSNDSRRISRSPNHLSYKCLGRRSLSPGAFLNRRSQVRVLPAAPGRSRFARRDRSGRPVHGPMLRFRSPEPRPARHLNPENGIREAARALLACALRSRRRRRVLGAARLEVACARRRPTVGFDPTTVESLQRLASPQSRIERL